MLAHPAPAPDEVLDTVKTTTMFRTIANPRRTTLAHLADAEELRAPEQEHSVDLPSQTANPRRTILVTAPARSAE